MAGLGNMPDAALPMMAWRPRRPSALLGVMALGAILCAILVLRLLILYSNAGDPVYSVRQVVLEQGFVPWEGERLGVRGLVPRQTTGCDGPTLEIVDPQNALIRLRVAFSPAPPWLSAIGGLPGMGLLVPPGLPASPHGLLTIKGHLTLMQAAPCPPASAYMLVADRYQ